MEEENSFIKYTVIDDISILIDKLETYKLRLEIARDRELDFSVIHNIHEGIKELTKKNKIIC